MGITVDPRSTNGWLVISQGHSEEDIDFLLGSVEDELLGLAMVVREGRIPKQCTVTLHILPPVYGYTYRTYSYEPSAIITPVDPASEASRQAVRTILNGVFRRIAFGAYNVHISIKGVSDDV